MGAHTKIGMHVPLTASWGDAFFNKFGYTQAPAVIQCYLTLRCNLSCAHCLAVPADNRDRKDMPLELFEKLCREATALGDPEMLLTGGEPLQHEQLAQCLDHLKAHRLAWSLNTAACPTPAQQIAIRAYPPVFVAVSLDGPRKVHNAFRGHPAAYDSALNSLRFFAGLPTTVVCAGTTVSTVNYPYLDETFALVRQSSAHRWGIHLLIPEGRARQRKDLFLRTTQLRKLLKFVALKRAEFPVSLCDEMGRVGQWEPLVRDEVFFCGAGRTLCAVWPDGSVMPCSTLDPRHCEGNLTREAFATIWNSRFERQRFPRRMPKCAACEQWLECGSGCWLHRQQGTQCFKQVWSVPPVFKKAAGISFLVGSLGAQGTEFTTQPTTTIPLDSIISPTGSIRAPLILKGVSKGYGSKAGSGGKRERPQFTQANQAIVRCLQWLKEQQNADGSWSKDDPVLCTSLALLCYLGNSATMSDATYGPTIEKAIYFLSRKQLGDGTLESTSPRPANPYTHAIATYALAKTYAMTRIPELLDRSQKAAQYIAQGQRPDGGWGLNYAKDEDWNLTFSVWQIMALRTSLWGAPDADAALIKAEAFMEKTFIEGAFRDSPALRDTQKISAEVQGAGILGMVYLDKQDGNKLDMAHRLIQANTATAATNSVLDLSQKCMRDALFQSYLLVLAMFTSRADETFCQQVYVALIKAQDPDGHWNCPASPGVSTPAVKPTDIFINTMLRCLTLEVYIKRDVDFSPRPSVSDIVIKVL